MELLNKALKELGKDVDVRSNSLTFSRSFKMILSLEFGSVETGIMPLLTSKLQKMPLKRSHYNKFPFMEM